MQFEVGPNLEPVVVKVLEAELLVDADSPSLGLQTDGFCLDCVLTVWSQLQLDADIAGRETHRITYWNNGTLLETTTINISSLNTENIIVTILFFITDIYGKV